MTKGTFQKSFSSNKRKKNFKWK